MFMLVSIDLLKIQKNTFLNITLVWIVVTSRTKYPQEYITVRKNTFPNITWAWIIVPSTQTKYPQKNTQQYISYVYNITTILHLVKIQNNTFLNLRWVRIVVTSPTKYLLEYITLNKQCVSYIHPSTKDLKECLSIPVLKIRKITFLNLRWVWNNIPLPTKYLQKYRTVHYQCVSNIHTKV